MPAGTGHIDEAASERDESKIFLHSILASSALPAPYRKETEATYLFLGLWSAVKDIVGKD